MPVETMVPANDPMMKAWERYRVSEEFANALKWAAHDEHVQGSLWAAFCMGWAMREYKEPTPIARTADTE